MTETHVVMANAHGLHARPAGEFVQAARRFSSRVRVACGEKEADGRSILALLGLGIKPGSTVIIRAEGADEAEAATALAQLLGGLE